MHHRQNHWFDLSYYTVFPLLSPYGLVLFQCLGTHYSIIDGGGGGANFFARFFFSCCNPYTIFFGGL